MNRELTPAAYRALAEAAAWAGSTPDKSVDVPCLLLGLLAEPECRAAAMLADHAVDAAAVRKRWPNLARTDPPGRETREVPEGTEPILVPPKGLGPDIDAALDAAANWMALFGDPAVLATEHLLLGILCCQSEAAVWLIAKGLSAAAVEAEIARIYEYTPESASSGPPEGVRPLDMPEGTALHTVPPRESHSSPRTAANLETPPCPALQGPVAVLRILDAAANRAREGLRVVEDYVRFVLDDSHLTAQLKQIRHDLAAALEKTPVRARLAARDTQADVGTAISTPSERRRADLAQVVTANFIRLQEALRSLDEFGKLLDPTVAAAIEALRYRAYTLHRAVAITSHSLDRLAGARLYVLVDGRATPEEFRRLVGQLTEAGVHLIQLRDKGLDDRRLLKRARVLRELTGGTHTLAIINDRPDLAALSRADGVHVGQEEISVKDARSIVGPDALVGVSTHSIGQARQAVLDGADYIGVGPTFPSATKQFQEFPGLELLRAVASEIRLPAFAIGGVTEENLSAVLDTGIRRVAVSGAILSAEDPKEAARRLLLTLENA